MEPILILAIGSWVLGYFITTHVMSKRTTKENVNKIIVPPKWLYYLCGTPLNVDYPRGTKLDREANQDASRQRRAFVLSLDGLPRTNAGDMAYGGWRVRKRRITMGRLGFAVWEDKSGLAACHAGPGQTRTVRRPRTWSQQVYEPTFYGTS